LDVQTQLAEDRADYPLTYWPCNATAKADLEHCRTEILNKYGRVDVLLNGAGVNAPTPFLDIETAEMDRILQSHVHATVYGCQVFGETMLTQKSRSILHFASA